MKTTLFILSLLLMIQTAVKAQQVDSVQAERAKRDIEEVERIEKKLHDKMQSLDSITKVDPVHLEKAKRIIEKLASQGPFPSKLVIDTSLERRRFQTHVRGFDYRSQRMLKGTVCDSVRIHFFINDSLGSMNFFEVFYLPHDTEAFCYYNLEQGKITDAQFNGPGPLTQRDFYSKESTNIKFDSTLFINLQYTVATDDREELERRLAHDRKAAPFYLTEINYSIDELYELLNK